MMVSCLHFRSESKPIAGSTGESRGEQLMSMTTEINDGDSAASDIDVNSTEVQICEQLNTANWFM
jgi:hypothetical protein